MAFESATESEVPPASRWGVLRHPDFRRVIAAQFISNIGTWTEMFAIQTFVAQATGRLDDQGLLGICQMVPVLLFGIFGGLLADRVDRRLLLVVTQILAGIVAICVAIVSMITFASPRSAVYWLCGLGAINGTVMAFNFPAWQVLTPRLVPKAELVRAITLNGIQFNLARVIGPAIAGLVLGSLGTPPLLWFNALTFFMMAGVIMTTPPTPPPPSTGEAVWPRIREAAQFILFQRGPRAVFLAQVMLSLLAAPLVRLLSNFSIDVYKLEHDKAERVASLLLTVQGVGAVAGGLALRLVPSWYPKHHFIPMAVTGLALSITGFALTRSPLVGYSMMLICGWFWIWSFNQSWAAMQLITPDKIRGRALSIVTVAAFGATALGVGIAGFIGERLKAPTVLDPQRATQASVLLLSLPLLAAGLVMMVWRVPEVDGLPRIRGSSGKSRSLIEAVIASEHRPRQRDDAGTAGVTSPPPV